jgi:hypothetical protein
MSGNTIAYEGYAEDTRKSVFVLMADCHCRAAWLHKPTLNEIRYACPENAPEPLVTALGKFQDTVFEGELYVLQEVGLH